MKLSEIYWGDDSAEKDLYLFEYFVTSDAFKRLRKKTKGIVVGRKGSGKSALRKKLEQEFSVDENTYVIDITPKYNSIRSILNDKTIMNSFGQEIFFQYTWLRHILLDSLCGIGDDIKGQYAKDSVEFARKIALKLNRTSKDFVENITDVLSRLKVKAGSLGELGIQLEKELRNVAEVDALEYNLVQIAESGAKFVILIDDLDLGWDNSLPSNNLLLGLLSATSYLSSKSHNIYTCVFLREDVYSILLSLTQHSDKYRNVERIRWEKNDLINILNLRIAYNRKNKGLPPIDNPFLAVFPETLGTSNTDNWLIERTLARPRELIQLARYYTESVDGEEPDVDALKNSEADYSSWKLDDLCSEYSNQYPDLISVFAYWKTTFFRHKYHLPHKEIEDMLFKIALEVKIDQPWFNKIRNEANTDYFLKILYDIGFIGDFVLGGEGGSKTFYSYNERHEPHFDEVQIHPCFRRAVNSVERIRTKKNESTEI